MNKDKRAKKIAKLVKSIYSSLESHLLWTHRHSSEGKKFHKDCVKGYAEQLCDVTDLY